MLVKIKDLVSHKEWSTEFNLQAASNNFDCDKLATEGRGMMNQDFLTKGKNALAIGAWEEARDHLESAVHSKESADALENLAWAYWWLSDFDKVFKLRTKAHQIYLTQNDKPGASRTASWLGLDYLEFNGEFAVANGWFQRAESLLEGETPCKELCLIKTLKANLAFRVEKNINRAIGIIDDTIDLCKRLDDVEGLMLAEGLKGFMLVTEGNIREGMQLLDEATVLALSEQSNDIHMITTTCCFLIDACQRIRDYERAGQWCTKVKEICKRWRHRAVFATCRTQYASVLTWRGEWEEAETELLAAMNELVIYKPTGINACITRLADLRRRQGRFQEATKLFEQGKPHGTKSLSYAELAYDQGNFQLAHDLTDKFLRQIPDNERTERIAGLELFIRTKAKLGQLENVEKSINELEQIASALRTPPIQAAFLNAQGILNFARSKYDLSRKNLEDAIDLYEQIPSPFEASRARVALVLALEKLDLLPAAKNELRTAIKTLEELGAKGDLDKAKQILKQLGKTTPQEHGFTKRELDILILIAEGKNNKEISDTLFLSVRTIEKHLSNIYQKLGISGKSARAFAASFASKELINR